MADISILAMPTIKATPCTHVMGWPLIARHSRCGSLLCTALSQCLTESNRLRLSEFQGRSVRRRQISDVASDARLTMIDVT